MKQSKLLQIGLAVFAILMVFSLFLSRGEEQEIADFVLQHQEELESIAARHLSGDPSAKTFRDVKVNGAFGDMVQFYYSGAGMVTSTTYYGFYYSRDGEPAAFQDAEVPLIAVSDTEWSWTDDTDNGGVTKRITENWFYYEAWF